MDRSWGTFRTTEGTVSVGPQALHIDRTPLSYLRGLFAGWHSGDLARRAWAGYRFFALIVFPVVTFYQLSRFLETSRVVSIVAGLGWIGFALLPTVVRYREQSIARSAITDVTLNPDRRRLNVTHEPTSRLSALVATVFGTDSNSWSGGDRSTKLVLPDTDDVRDARSTLRAAGVVDTLEDLESEENRETESIHRVETRRGVVFCEACGSQVSPADASCSSCGGRLRVERPATDSDRDVRSG